MRLGNMTKLILRQWVFLVPFFCGTDATSQGITQWQPGEVIHTKSVKTICMTKYCDPAPTFIVVESSDQRLLDNSVFTTYKLLDTLYPSDSEEYHRLLMRWDRKRLCHTCKQDVDSKCSYFTEFIVNPMSPGKLRFVSFEDPSYDDIFLQILNSGAESSENEQPEEDDATIYYVIGAFFALLCLLVLFGVLYCLIRRSSSIAVVDSTGNQNEDGREGPQSLVKRKNSIFVARYNARRKIASIKRSAHPNGHKKAKLVRYEDAAQSTSKVKPAGEMQTITSDSN